MVSRPPSSRSGPRSPSCRSSTDSRRRSRATPCNPLRRASPILPSPKPHRTRQPGHSLVPLAAPSPKPSHESAPISCTRIPKPTTSIPETAPKRAAQTPIRVPAPSIATLYPRAALPSPPAPLAGSRISALPKPAQLHRARGQPSTRRTPRLPAVSSRCRFHFG
ncbi:hypothetical protein B0H17DRAFT_1056588 [Mycena rosella]|uniref:Uncharacterized protein n=1 Tax=Mycena rosella TaxID=1033263 RepID=A0AAD7DMZ2_MYCRO|nr:hypothetical protein B0H17DRAFT_1056588 [Mycena rosella]